MAWSTRELADLAGTTLKAVRHYHEVGILEEPERSSNGYKQYEVRHLVRLLHIRRLVDLGLPLAQIASIGPDEDLSQTLGLIDAELAATIDRLQRVRIELAAIQKDGEPTDLPAGFGAAGKHLSPADRSLMMIYSRVFDATALGDMRRMVSSERTRVDIELGTLASDADTATKVRLAETLAPELRELSEKYPWLSDPGSRASSNAALTENTVTQAVSSLLNKAQLEVLYRAHLIATGATDDRLSTLEEKP